MTSPLTAAVVRSRLSALPMFSALSGHELDLLTSSTRVLSFRKGARIFEEGSLADCCYLLLDGRAKAVREAENGSELLVKEFGPGDLIGELALLDGLRRSTALVAVERCHLLAIPAAVFETIRRNPLFEQNLVVHVASMVRHSTDHVFSISTGTSISRVAWCLVNIASREGTREGKTVIIQRKPHQVLAAMAGCERETVSRALGTLKRKKCVSWDSNTMRLQIEALQRYIRTDTAAGNWLPARGT